MLQHNSCRGVVPKPMGNNHPNVVPYRVFAVADGHIIIAAAMMVSSNVSVRPSA
jgi:Predicted acyl-CoA transferases/carnitine dehydratase